MRPTTPDPDKSDAGYKNLVGGLARKQRQVPPGSPAASSGQPNSDTGTSATASFAWTEPTRPEQSDLLRRKGLELTDAEIEFMQAMAPIAAKSPRAVKRMINLYRLIRVGYRGDQLKLLLAEGGDGVPTYRELILALAWETGFSAASRAKLRACAMQPAPPNWQAVSLKECLDGGEAASFQEVLPHLSGLRLKRLFNAVEEVRRYSFSDWT